MKRMSLILASLFLATFSHPALADGGYSGEGCDGDGLVVVLSIMILFVLVFSAWCFVADVRMYARERGIPLFKNGHLNPDWKYSEMAAYSRQRFEA